MRGQNQKVPLYLVKFVIDTTTIDTLREECTESAPGNLVWWKVATTLYNKEASSEIMAHKHT